MGYAKLKTTTTPLLKGGDYGGKVSSSSRHVGLSVHDVWPADVGPDVARSVCPTSADEQTTSVVPTSIPYPLM